MRKKELLKIPELLVTPAVRDAERKYGETESKKGYGATFKYYQCARFCRAAVYGDILKVAVFTHDSIRDSMDPKYEIYIDKKEEKHLTYETETGKWRTGKIDSLEVDHKEWRETQIEWSSAADRKQVNKYLETGLNRSIYEAVLQWQRDIRKSELRMKSERELDRIDAVMREVPEEPKDLKEWIRKNVFDESIFYLKNNKRSVGYCTHCEKWVDLSGKEKHKDTGTCPNCRHKVKFRSWNKQKYQVEEGWAGVLQRLEDRDGYILRGYHCEIKRTNEAGWDHYELSIFENTRTRLDQYFSEVEQYEYTEYRYTRVTRWCHPQPHGYYGSYQRFGRARMYTRNLKKELKNEKFASVNVAKLMRYGREYVEPSFILKTLYYHPYVEYLQKSGLNRLADEIMTGKECSGHMDGTKERIHEVLKLDKQRFQRMKQINGGRRTLVLLQAEEEYGGKVTEEVSEWVEREKIETEGIVSMMKRTGLNITQIINYIRKQMEITGMDYRATMDMYADYINMARDRGMDVTDDIVRRQKDMRGYHDRYTEEKNQIEAKKRDREVNRKFVAIAREYERNQKHFAFETKELVILVPKKASDITKEGRKQHHCVGASDTYLSSMNQGKSYIVFLRKKSQPSMPYYTIEIEWNGKIRQWYGAYDRKPDEDKIKKVLERYTKRIAKRCMEEEIKQKEKAEQTRIRITAGAAV